MASLEKRVVWLPLCLRCECSFSSKLQGNLGGRLLLAPYQWVLPGTGVRKSGAGIQEELPTACREQSCCSNAQCRGVALVLRAVAAS